VCVSAAKWGHTSAHTCHMTTVATLGPHKADVCMQPSVDNEQKAKLKPALTFS